MVRTGLIFLCVQGEKSCVHTQYASLSISLRISFAVTAKLISAFVFATRLVQFLYFLDPKFPVSSHLLCLYSLCVGPVRKPHCWFSHKAAHLLISLFQFDMLELDRLEKNLEPCPLLINVSSYQPDTVDLTQDKSARDYWLQCFVESIEKVRVEFLGSY